MSFSKAKLKRFNDVDVAVPMSPAKHVGEAGSSLTPTPASSMCSLNNAAGSTSANTASTTSCSNAHPERKEQIEKFFKDAVRFATSSKEAKEFAIPKEGGAPKEDKKSKGLRLFRTPSLPHRLRFRQNTEVPSVAVNNNNAGTASSTPMHSATTTPVKEMPKSASRLKGKEALQYELRNKNELLESYMSQIEVLKRHVEQLKETEAKLREEHALVSQKTDNLIHELTNENLAHKEFNDDLSVRNEELSKARSELEEQLKSITEQHSQEVSEIKAVNEQLLAANILLEQEAHTQQTQHHHLQLQISQLEQEIFEARERLAADEERSQQNFELIENLKNTNDALIVDVKKLTAQIEQDALAYGQENKITQNEMECLKNERNTLKNDLASKCELIRSFQEELLDKNCEIDAHCDTIRQLCREKAKYVEKERMMDVAEEKVRHAETQAEQKVQKLESDLENSLEREKAYWRAELDRRQKMAENEIIKIELEKQDVMVLLESTNDMLRDRDEKIQKYEDQLRNGLDYYIQLTDNLQKQVVDLKQDVAKTITEKYNYQLTLSNTRSTVNILMERLKKSDADVEQFKAELESVQLAKGALEQSYISLQSELERLRSNLQESETTLKSLRDSSQALQQEVSVKENMFNEILTSEEETLAKFNKIASSFQQRIDADAAQYLDMYHELKNKDEKRELYMQDMKKALDEFSTVLQFAQLELDSKDKCLVKVKEECEQLKLENISLKSKVSNEVNNTPQKRQNTTDLEKIENLLCDSELRSECDKITSWLLSGANTTDKSVRTDSNNEISDLLKPSTPLNNKNRNCTTPVRSSGGAKPTTPRTPKTHTPRTTPKKTVLFAGKENMPSPQKQVLKARNM